jgi:hypothetical protein
LGVSIGHPGEFHPLAILLEVPKLPYTIHVDNPSSTL